jgi:hypothetical protein
MTPTWRAVAAVGLAGLLAGCGSAAPADPAPPTPADPPSSPAPRGAPGAEAGGPACVDSDITVSTVRGIADALERGPVLSAGVELFLTGPREQAATPQAAGPELTRARAELVAAIDDLDAQARTLLPPGGNAARDPVQLNPTRILAAADEIERLCGTA